MGTVLGILGFLLAVSTAAAEPWVFNPASVQARLIANLFWVTLVLAGVVLVLVEGLLIYSSVRFRRRAPVPLHEPPQIHGNTRLEVMWAIVPASILIGLFVASVPTLNAISAADEASAASANALRIGVTGSQFSWAFNYANDNVETMDEVRIPLNRPVLFELTARDVIHSFWVPELHGKLDAVPGRINRLSMQADKVGTYRGVCAELCGPGHGNMLFTVQVLPAEEFDRWLADQKSGSAQRAAAGPSGERGREVFVAKGCGSCHTLAAVPGTSGQVGPALNGVGTRAGTRKPGTTADAYLRESLQSPNAFVAPGFAAAMPTIPMSDDELSSLVQFLLDQK